MREIVRPAASALSVACLAFAMSAVSSGERAGAGQAGAAEAGRPGRRPRRRRQRRLRRQADRADREADRGRARGAQGNGRDHREDCRTTPSRIRRSIAQLDGVAKKNGFASYDEYNNVVDNISLVLGGFDPATKKYVGAEAVIKAQIAAGPGRQEDAGQGQEGSARRSQRGAEVAAAGDREQGQHRSRRPNITTSSPRRSARARNSRA